MDEYTFDLERWRKQFEDYESFKASRGGFSITGPRDIVYLEALRARVAAHCDLGLTVPADVFVFGLGKSPRRDMTKIGGVPYRPADLPWPASRTGEDMTFLAQYRFAESKDIAGDLPGDILLVFIEGREIDMGLPREFLHFEWHPVGLGDLWLPDYVPAPAWPFVNCYGLRHRTRDYQHDVPVDVFRGIVPANYYSEETLRVDIAAFSRVQGMKLGGLPTFAYGADESAQLDGKVRFLCSLAALYPFPLGEYPWLNVHDPPDLTQPLWPEMCLDFRDGFILDFWLDKHEEISWVVRFV